MTATDLALALEPGNVQLLKLKGDILRDMKDTLEAEKVKYYFVRSNKHCVHSIIGRHCKSHQILLESTTVLQQYYISE